ncbi:terminase large subunit domain-containing protein [Sphingomonas sp. MMS24-JH45]
MWLIRAGRGFGKTRAGAQWVNDLAEATPGARIALVGATIDDARRVMVQGPSGVVATAKVDLTVAWSPTHGEVRFPNGAVAQVYSAAAPEGLRGPERRFAWADELGRWRTGRRRGATSVMGLRLGERPRMLVTTTPRRTALMRRVMALPDLVRRAGRRATTGICPARSWRRSRPSTAGRGWAGRSWTARCWTTSRVRCGRAR